MTKNKTLETEKFIPDSSLTENQFVEKYSEGSTQEELIQYLRLRYRWINNKAQSAEVYEAYKKTEWANKYGKA